MIVTSDHGGKGKGHGGDTPEEREIPWIVWGATVRKGTMITEPIQTYDTAATIAYLFGLQTPECWIGKPVIAAFETNFKP